MTTNKLSFKQYLVPALDEIAISTDFLNLEILHEGWIAGRFDRNIRIDHPTHLHGDGQDHAHVYGRKGDQIGVVNFDGTSSHGTKCRLHDADADALRAKGFNIAADNIVEWVTMMGSPVRFLLG